MMSNIFKVLTISLLATTLQAADCYVVTMILHPPNKIAEGFLINELRPSPMKEAPPITSVWKTSLSRTFLKELYEKKLLRNNPCFSWIIEPTFKKQSLLLVKPFCSLYPILSPSVSNDVFSKARTYYRRTMPWSGTSCGYMEYWKLSDWHINMDLEINLEGSFVKFTEKLNVNQWTIIDNPSVSALIRIVPLVSNT